MFVAFYQRDSVRSLPLPLKKRRTIRSPQRPPTCQPQSPMPFSFLTSSCRVPGLTSSAPIATERRSRLLAAFADVAHAYTHRLRTSGYGSRHCLSGVRLCVCQTYRAICVPFSFNLLSTIPKMDGAQLAISNTCLSDHDDE